MVSIILLTSLYRVNSLRLSVDVTFHIDQMSGRGGLKHYRR